ncbi:hypothetical protein PG991_013939 [Apiospora marii]|uniref:Uncharacterized protein n=1 Tax=Apiospora marii TaxID=335849 RepID=A0ABR1R7L1_9PEZI
MRHPPANSEPNPRASSRYLGFYKTDRVSDNLQGDTHTVSQIMMDPVSIVFTVLPLLAGAVKAYTSGKLDRQYQIFVNETHLLVRTALIDDDVIERMLDDPEHSQWQSNDLESTLKEFLSDSYDAYLGIVDEWCRRMQVPRAHLLYHLRGFTNIQQGMLSKGTTPHFGSRVMMACSTVGFEKTIEGLRELNGDLGRLRQQSSELQRPGTKLPDRLKEARMCSGQGDFQAIRKASKDLHQALTDGWSRNAPITTPGNMRHDVKLFADAKVKEGVCSNLAIFCRGHHMAPRWTSRPVEPTWSVFQVQSQALEWVDTGWDTPPDSDDDDRPKRRKMNSANPPTLTYLTEVTPEPEDTNSDGLCLGLHKPSVKSSSTIPHYCLGYMDNSSENSFRHSFYQGKTAHHPVPTIRDQAVSKSYTMGDILAEALDGCQSVLRQLLLARYVVSTVLKFHSTPWLGEYTTAKDIFFLGKLKASNLAEHLDTMHLETSFINDHEPRQPDPDCPMDDPASTKAFEDAKIQYGVRNVTLWCLGTMLLQIACWRQIDAADDVATIRRLSSLVCCPGPRYQRLTKKCLECDFGYGDDLAQPRLQQAVYKGLICELNDMIRSLDINAGV